MDIFQLSSFIFIVLLIIASIQDFLKKSVSDIIHYLLIVFAFSIAMYNIYLQRVSENIIFSYSLLLFFFLMYLLRYLAIGDIYIMFSLFIFLANFNFMNLFKFLIMLTIGGIFVHSLEAIKIFYRKREKKNVIIFTISIIFGFISGILYSISFSSLTYHFLTFLLSSAFILIPTIILKLYEERIKKELTFERTVDELVEGDWIENEIKLKDISDKYLNEIKENFVLEIKDNFYIIKLKHNKINFRFLIFLILILPFLFYSNYSVFLLSSIFVIIILTILHDKIFKDHLGLSRKQIELLKKVVSKDTKFIVREGAPFVPAITFAYIFSMI